MKDGIIIQFQLNVIVLQINSGCTACSTIAQCNMIISTVLTRKGQYQTEDDISIPRIHIEHEAEVLQILLSQVDPLQSSDAFGIDIYLDAVVKVNDFLHLLGTS